MPVDPRMSANRRLTGISAPKTPSLLRPLMHEPQMAGLPGNRAKPTWRRTAPAGPSKGAAQSLQLGPWGRCRITRRMRARDGSSPERKPRIASSGVLGRGIALRSYSQPLTPIHVLEGDASLLVLHPRLLRTAFTTAAIPAH